MFVTPMMSLTTPANISYGTLGMILGYILYYFQLCLLILTFKMGKKGASLGKICLNFYTYSNVVMLLGKNVKMTEFFGKFFYGLYFGYFGHFWNWILLFSDKNSLFFKIWNFDKIGPFEMQTERFVSAFAAQ